MKNRSYALIIAAISLSLVACGQTAEPTNSEIIVNESNPWTTSDKQGVFDATGFNLIAPEGATDVNYSYVADEGIAQLTYVYEGADWVYRIRSAQALSDISGMNYEWITDIPGQVSGLEAKYTAYSEQAEDSEYIDDMFYVQVVNWYDDAAGVTYSLSASGTNIDGIDIESYAENLYSLVQ